MTAKAPSGTIILRGDTFVTWCNIGRSLALSTHTAIAACLIDSYVSKNSWALGGELRGARRDDICQECGSVMSWLCGACIILKQQQQQQEQVWSLPSRETEIKCLDTVGLCPLQQYEEMLCSIPKDDKATSFNKLKNETISNAAFSDDVDADNTDSDQKANIEDDLSTDNSNQNENDWQLQPEPYKRKSAAVKKWIGFREKQDVFSCDVCTLKFSSEQWLVAHKRRSHRCNKDLDDRTCVEVTFPSKPFCCDICSQSFFSERWLERHKENKHKTKCENTFQCSLCPKSFWLKRWLQHHIQRVHAKGEEGFDVSAEDSAGNGTAIEKAETTLESPVPPAKEKDGENSKTKARKKQKVEAGFVAKKQIAGECAIACPVCGHKLSTEKRLKIHMKKWHENTDGSKRVLFCTDPAQKPYQCSICKRCFLSRHNMRRHMREEHGNVDDNCGYECKECGRKFRFVGHFQKHMREAHFSLFTSFTCNHCGQVLRSKKNLDNHMRRKHTTPSLPPICVQCDKQFTCQSGLRKHMKQVHERLRPHNCSICNKAFYALYSLENHMKVHSEDRPLVCEVCGKSFKTSSTLQCHMYAHDDTQFSCKMCNKMFRTKLRLRRHVKLSHNAKKNYSCHSCPKTFSRPDSLRSHLLVHTGEKKHVCEYCNKAFTLPTTLSDHRKLHLGIKPHICSICGKGFAIPREMRRHKKLAHGIIETPSQALNGQNYQALVGLKLGHVTLESEVLPHQDGSISDSINYDS